MRIIKRITKWLMALAALGLLAAVMAAGGIYYYFSPQLPDAETLREVEFQTPLRVYSADEKLIAEFGEMRRTPISYADIPQHFIHALQAAEDARFFEHQGIDLRGLFRAAFQLATSGKIQSGGSTITMQVAKNFFLTRERTFERKFVEILLALSIEQSLSKQEILELYINKIYLGHRSYGIQAAAQVYYGKPINQLNIAQLAMIAGLPKAPSAYNPITNPQRALERRNWILGRMQELGFITSLDYSDSVNQPVTASYHGADIEIPAPYVAEMVRAELYETYGEKIYTDGMKAYTTIDSTMQRSANQALRTALLAYTERHGYRGPEQHFDLTEIEASALLKKLKATPAYGGLEAALVKEVDDSEATLLLGDGSETTLRWSGISWARAYKGVNSTGPEPKKASEVLAVGDIIRIRQTAEGWRLSQLPEVQGAFIAINPENGAIQSLTGGFSFYLNKFNRATQAYRQPGSNIKPFLYSAALSNGYTPGSVINDAPVVFHDVSLEGNWRPENDNGKFGGPTRLREALYRSRNLISIRLMRALGIEETRDFILGFGFEEDKLPKNLSLSLGSADATPLQVATGYASIANGGFKISPYIIESVLDREGLPLFAANPSIACSGCPERQQAELIAQELADMASDEATSDAQASTEGQQPLVTLTGQPLAMRLLDERTAYIIHDMMRDVIKKGTGRRALALKRGDLAGKTGTTNDQKDSWFSGFTPKLSATAWVGFDQPSHLGKREWGSTAALPMWIDFMGDALRNIPESYLPEPAGIATALIDPATGLLAYEGQKNAYNEIFKEEQVPTEVAPKPGSEVAAPTSEELFR